MKQNRKFLIVDDDRMIRSVLQKLFTHYGLECILAGNGKQAVEKWEQEDFCAILMDLDMPLMDGCCACKIIRQREEDEKRTYTPIIAVSGQDSMAGKVKSMEAGMNAFIPKPFTIDEIWSVVFPLTGLPYEKNHTAENNSVSH